MMNDDQEPKSNAEAVGRAIANELGLEYEFRNRAKTGSGMKTLQSPSPRCARQGEGEA